MSQKVFEPINDGGVKFSFYDDHIEIVLSNYFGGDFYIDTAIYDNVAISFDDERYKQIYESVKEKMAKKSHYWEKSKDGEVIPDIHKIPPTDFSKWTKEDLIKFIEASKVYEPDLRHSFDSSMFKVKYTKHYQQFYDIVENEDSKNLKVLCCTNWKHRGRVCISDTFEIEDFGKVVYNNRAFIREYLNYLKCSHLHSITVYNIHYTDELIVPRFILRGVFNR